MPEKQIPASVPAPQDLQTSQPVDLNKEIDGQGSAPATLDFPVVGIGASAGGLAAFEAFLSGVDAEMLPGMAYVLVQHLAPDHKSMLAELIRRYTKLQVYEVEDGMPVQVNCAYIIPPGRDMAYANGYLQLLEPSVPRGQRLPIDFLFRSLANGLGERAIGIVLSGTGSDGTLGLRAIKGEGGMAMAQMPASAEFDGMPRSAIATGLVDFQLPPAEMPAKLAAYVRQAFGRLAPSPSNRPLQVENARRKIFLLLRNQVGHDFSQYKPSTIYRRIERRMAVHQIESIETYAQYLQQAPTEVEALFRELLIGVTSFFRDPAAFQTLEDEAIAQFLRDRLDDDPIRIWVAGCSTGEEPYSIAMLLMEQMTKLNGRFPVQLFATDLDPRAIAIARSGLYPANVAADLAPERLNRFFSAEADGQWRILKSIRDMVIFSEHDVLKDPPFSRLDLISCRNLLIYLDQDLQKKLIPLFHYAIKPRGWLFLGNSEGVGDFDRLFTATKGKAKLFQRRSDLVDAPSPSLWRMPIPVERGITARPFGKPLPAAKPSLREIAEQSILRQVAPVSALLNDRGDVLYLHGRSGKYLEPAAGEAGPSNILKMAREGLRAPLAATFRRVVASQQQAAVNKLSVKTNGHYTLVDLTIYPLSQPKPAAQDANLFMLMLADSPMPLVDPNPALGATPAQTDLAEAEKQIAALEQELRSKDDFLLSGQEALESANEELKSAVEEMQSVNEELQSTNEELETSKEELQSVNEELATVNTELHTKVLDLSRANNDMNNLLAGTGIGTVFVDHQLRILRFTPAASEIINLILSDIGRPVGHIVNNLVGYDRLARDLQQVLDQLTPLAIEVKSLQGRWYMLRIQPYRTLENVIEGAVMTFVDISELKQAEAALRQSSLELQRLAVIIRDANDAISVHDLTGRILAWNPGAERLYGWSEAEALTMKRSDLIVPEFRAQALDKLLQLSKAQILQPYSTPRLTKSGAVITVSTVATPLKNETGEVYAIANTERAATVNESK
jgi:two-component system CheB/CheR fusion protein